MQRMASASSVHRKYQRTLQPGVDMAASHKLPAAWCSVVDFLVKLCSHDSFKHILKLFWVGKKSATFCLSARKRVVSARFRVTRINATSHSKGYEFLGIYRLWCGLSLRVVVFNGGGILCIGSYFRAGRLSSYCCVEGLPLKGGALS